MGIERLARKNRQLQKHALKHWARNLPSEVRERIIAHEQRQRKRAAIKRALLWCGVGMVFLIAGALALGGCDEPSAIESEFPVGDCSQSDANRLDAPTPGVAVGGNVDVGHDTAALDGAVIDANQNTVGDGGPKRDAQSADVGDGLCWYRHECPVGHFRCANADGTPVSDAQCLTQKNLCLCCDTSVPAFSCAGVSQ